METYKKIHKEFNSSLNNAITSLEDVLTIRTDTLKASNNSLIKAGNEELYDMLDTIGFGNTKTKQAVNKISNIKDSVQSVTNIKKAFTHYANALPYKIITYSQIITIMDKYDLYLGSNTLFTGDIPEKNIKDIKQYLENVGKSTSVIFNGTSFINGELSLEYNTFNPSFEQIRQYSSYYHNRIVGSKFHICAPKKDFKNGLTAIGRELIDIKKPKMKWELSLPEFKSAPVEDPVVLNMIPTLSIMMGQPVFYIVTAWGPESSDILIANEKMN